MARFICLISLLISFSVNADLFDFADKKNGRQSKLPDLIGKLKKMELKNEPNFEEEFNLLVKSIENAVEEEKLFCSGESVDSEGKALPPGQKQLCIRDLKNFYLEATQVIFEQKKKYLGLIHQKQVDRLTEIQKRTKTDIEKNF